MKKIIDCLLIGHNEKNFVAYVQDIKKMGLHSGAYRDLNLSFLQYKGKPHHASGIFNLICSGDSFPGVPGKQMNPIRNGETFSAAISYLGTYLHRRGLTFDYINSFQEEKEELANKLRRENILTIAITTTLYVTAFPILEIIDFIRTYNQTARIIIGGPFVATRVRVSDAVTLEFLFKSLGADYYINSSQGEAALVKLIRAIKNNLPVSEIDNIYYKAPGGYKAAPILKEDNKLSANMVDWKLFPDNTMEYINLRTSISCPFSCAFCGFPEHAGKYQTVEIEAVEKELNTLRQKESVKNLYFIDDTLNLPVKRFKEFLRMLIRNKYGFKWQCQIRCQFIDREMAELMKESGCEGVFLGLESGCDQILKNMNKKSTAAEYIKGISLLKKYQIMTYGSFILGFPGETRETVKDTIQLIEESEIDFFRTQLWYFEPITPIWRQKEKYHLKGSQFEWSHATMNSKEACDLIDRIFLSVKKSLWLPQYGFDFNTLFHLTSRGMSPHQVKNFVKAFNKGIKEKLLNPYRIEISREIIDDLTKSLTIENRYSHNPVIMETGDQSPGADFGEILLEEEDLIADFNLE